MKMGILVRDKDGKPKFGKPEQIKRFKHLMKGDDWKHLHEKYGDEWIDLDKKKTRK